MTALSWAWLLSGMGALLFFAAGGFFVARQSEVRRQRRRARIALATEARGEAVQTILDREIRGAGYTGAVVTDEFGLVVAASGDHAEALAAYGAFLAGVGTKTREGLPMQELRQLIIEDNRDTTLTVRPIAAADANLALVTLASGPPRAAKAAAIHNPSMER